jgi:hypothetical protein
MQLPLVLALVLLTLPVSAATRWGVRGGTSDGEAVVGGEFTRSINAHLLFNPNVEITKDRVSGNADLAWGFELTSNASAWIGGGVALLMQEEEDLDAGLNLLVGVGVQQGGWFPYVQLKATEPSSGEGYTTAVFGVRF